MSDVAIGRGSVEGAFRPLTVALMIGIGTLAFLAMLVLGAFAPDLRSGRNGGAHALSNAATGYSGIVRLAAATGHDPYIVRHGTDFRGENLLVLTPEEATADLDTPLSVRGSQPTLIVLPKWATSRDDGHAGWVRVQALLPPQLPQGVLAPQWRLDVRRYRSRGRPLLTSPDLPATIRFAAPRPLQSIRPGKDIVPLVVDRDGGIVVAQLGGGPLYLLADPDLLSNAGMRDRTQAAAALALLDWMSATGETRIGFDVTLNGLGHSPSPLKLAFEPPFLAMTLALAAAALMAGLHARGRFGPPLPAERAIAFGKAALVDNAALLMRKAGRERVLGPRYAALIRQRAVAAFGVPARLRDAALDAYLDRMGGRVPFTTLAAEADAARDTDGMLAAARALHAWQKEKIG